VILVVDHDPRRAAALVDLAHAHGFRAVVSPRTEWAISLARLYRPRGLFLSAAQTGDGNAVPFERLWHDPTTRSVPVHVLWPGPGTASARVGLRTYVRKPVTAPGLRDALARVRHHRGRDLATALVVAPAEAERGEIADVLGTAKVRATVVADAKSALATASAHKPDVIVLDMGLPGSTAEEVLEVVRQHPTLRETSVVLCTDAWADANGDDRIRRAAERMGATDAAEAERMAVESDVFLRRIEATLDEPRLRVTPPPAEPDTSLAGKRVLVVDDDVRNVFAITSMLERQGMAVRYATAGREALASLERDPGVDVVLMDIMMPGMDGYEVMREIRRIPRFAHLPIVALTAKAMAGDRERCLEAGASDYVTKPVEADILLSMLRSWLAR
jgi:CheY-like chemotaxis protein